MNLQALLASRPWRAPQGMPDWMMGFWKRYSISFADGRTDLKTHVCWLQSRNFTIDLRLPQLTDQVINPKAWADYSAAELAVLADYEGWLAPSSWDGRILQWHAAEASLQRHNRWPEPAQLQRIGNCMMEFCPSNAYVEDWRLQASVPGPLIGLRLLEERSLATAQLRHRGGGLIVCGDYAALVLGRAHGVDSSQPLKPEVLAAVGQQDKLAALLDFETSVAKGSLSRGYEVIISTRPGRMGQALFSLEGFAFGPDQADGTLSLVQRFADEHGEWERVFVVDTFETRLAFSPTTPWQAEAQAWYSQEAATLGRYLQQLY